MRIRYCSKKHRCFLYLQIYRDGHTCANKESVTYPGEPYETFTACGNYIKFTQKKLTESQYNAEKKIRNTLLNKCGLRAQDKPMFLNPSIPEDRILLLPYGIYHLWLSYAFIRHNCWWSKSCHRRTECQCHLVCGANYCPPQRISGCCACCEPGKIRSCNVTEASTGGWRIH